MHLTEHDLNKYITTGPLDIFCFCTPPPFYPIFQPGTPTFFPLNSGFFTSITSQNSPIFPLSTISTQITYKTSKKLRKISLNLFFHKLPPLINFFTHKWKINQFFIEIPLNFNGQHNSLLIWNKIHSKNHFQKLD